MKNFFIFLFLLSFLIISCNNNTKKVNIAEKDTLNINIGTEPPSLDGSLATDSTSYTILNNIMDGLTKFSHEHKPEPALAESWEISEDGKTFIFKIRDGVVWSDGVPLRAQDFEYSWNRILNPETAADYAPTRRHADQKWQVRAPGQLVQNCCAPRHRYQHGGQ